MAFSITLSENAAATHPDSITIKSENEIIGPNRTPIVIPLPGGSILALDLGRSSTNFIYTGIADQVVKEIFVDGLGGAGSFVAGETITGAAAWNATVTPARTNVATCIVRAGIPDLTTPTSLIVDTWGPAAYTDQFFVDGETISGATRTATVNKSFPSALRLWQIQRYWPANGVLTLTTSSIGMTFSVYIRSIGLQQEAGKEDRFEFKIDLAQAA